METRPGYNTGYKPPDLPVGLERAVLAVLKFHVGRENAIGRVMLVQQLLNVGFRVHERAARAAINELRKQGEPICSTGCESGPNRRPMRMDWAQSLRDQCVSANVPFFLKQMQVDGKMTSMPELDGQVWNQYPEVVHVG